MNLKRLFMLASTLGLMSLLVYLYCSKLQLGLFTVWVVLLVLQRWRRMTILKRHGIPGPEPDFFTGNWEEYSQTPNVIWDGMLVEKYGPVCGYYLGAKPVILVSHPGLIDKIQVFRDRPRRVPGGINPDPKRAKMLGNLQVSEWKILRSVLDKAFSPENLQSMFTDVEDLAKVFMTQISPGRVIDFFLLTQNLTLDLIGKTGFGIDSNIQANPNEALKSAVEQEFSKSTGTTLLKFYLCFPEIQKLFHVLRVNCQKLKMNFGFGEKLELWELGAEIVRTRRNADEPKHSDLLDLLLNSKKVKLDVDSIVANSVLFFEAGFETLSASLAFIIHLLMENPETQEDLRNEIRNVLEDTAGKLISKNQLKELTLLDAVIKEGLRMYPPQTTFIGRSGTEDLEHDFKWEGNQKHCTIPKNVHLQVCLYQILNSEEIWEEPRTFKPQRFLSQKDFTKEQKIAFQPFGGGTRICIGRKYADMVLKVVLLRLLSKYRLVPEAQGEEFQVKYKTATMTPKMGVYGRVILDPLFPQTEEDIPDGAK